MSDFYFCHQQIVIFTSTYDIKRYISFTSFSKNFQSVWFLFFLFPMKLNWIVSKNLTNLINLVNLCFAVEKGFQPRIQICRTPKFPKCLANCRKMFQMTGKSIAWNILTYFQWPNCKFSEYIAEAKKLRKSHRYLSVFRLIWR